MRLVYGKTMNNKQSYKIANNNGNTKSLISEKFSISVSHFAHTEVKRSFIEIPVAPHSSLPPLSFSPSLIKFV